MSSTQAAHADLATIQQDLHDALKPLAILRTRLGSAAPGTALAALEEPLALTINRLRLISTAMHELAETTAPALPTLTEDGASLSAQRP